MNYYFVNNELIKLIEEIKDINLDLVQIHIVSVVNSYSRVGKTCRLSTDNLAKQCRCSTSKITKSLKLLRDNNIISVYYPKNQAANQESNFTYLHENIKKAIVPDTIACKTGAPELLYQVLPNNKKIGDSSESFTDSSSSKLETNIEEYLNSFEF